MKTKRLTFLLPLTFLFLFASSCSEEGAKSSSEQSTSSDSTSAENVANEGNKITFVDCLLDCDTLIGKTVQISGVLVGTSTALYESTAGLGDNIMIKDKDLSRDDRKYILTNCNAGCEIEVVGTILRRDNFKRIQILAKKILH